jgi:hypothetical protein
MQRTAGNSAVTALLRDRARQQDRSTTGDQGTGAQANQLVVSRQTDQEIITAATTQPADQAGPRVLNLLLRRHFPAEERRLYLGSRIGGTGASLVADLAGGRGGSAMLVVGPDFGVQTTAATLAARVAQLRQVLVQVMQWRLTNRWLTEADLAFPEISGTVRSMDAPFLKKLLTAPKVDQDARKIVKQLLAIATPIGTAAALNADGSATEVVPGGVVIRVLPDKRAGSKNETTLAIQPTLPGTPDASVAGGRIATVDGPMPALPTVEIQTVYAASGPQAVSDPSTATSDYGAGTTASDKATGRTDIRYHEGRHGAVMLQYFRDHPYRPFKGEVGMTIDVWRAEGVAFQAAYRAWSGGAARAGSCDVDCVGSPTIDQFHAAEPSYVKVCSCGKS